MKKTKIFLLVTIIFSNFFYGQENKLEKIKPYITISTGYYNLHQYVLSGNIYSSYKYIMTENIQIKTGIGVENKFFKAGILGQILLRKTDYNYFLLGIETSGNILNFKDFYFGPLTQIGFFRSYKNDPLMSFDVGFLINWPTFFSLGLHGGYKFIEISVYKQYAGFVANKRSWMAGLSIDCLGLYRSFKKQPSD